MTSVPFVKYTSFGNSFVIVDQVCHDVLDENDAVHFARKATSTEFGIGCDNLLVLQPCNEHTLDAIHAARGYWQERPDGAGAAYVFRMFEPDGREALSCGNGLMSMAHMLHRRHGVSAARIMTEVPRATPRVVELGVSGHGRSVVNLGPTRRVPDDLAAPGRRRSLDESVDTLDEIEIRFDRDDLNGGVAGDSLALRGYLVHTGEPHVVLLPESFSDAELAGTLFSAGTGGCSTDSARRRISIGTWLLRRIGRFLNEQLAAWFPGGINVNVARVDRTRALIEYRCFERGIFRETLACGTGAVAVAAVAGRAGTLAARDVTVLPHRCRWQERDAAFQVREHTDGNWQLMGSPRMLVAGEFLVDETGVETPEAGRSLLDTGEMLALDARTLAVAAQQPDAA